MPDTAVDLALVNFVGVGLISFAPVYNIAVPEGAVANGTEILRASHQVAPQRTIAVMEAAATSMWTEWQQVGLSASVAVQHLTHLPELLHQCPPDKDLLVTAFAVASAKGKPSSNTLGSQARSISTDIVERARSIDFFSRHKLSESVCFFFLELMYIDLLLATSFIDSSQTVMAKYLSQLTNSDHGSRSVPMTPGRPADPFTSSEPGRDDATAETQSDRIDGTAAHFDAKWTETRSKIIADLPPHLAAGNDVQIDWADAEHQFDSLLEQLGAAEFSNDALNAQINSAQMCLHDHRLTDCDHALAETLALCEPTAEQPLHVDPTSVARIHAWRGMLNQIRLDYCTAAQCFAKAVKTAPHDQLEQRWHFTDKQLDALILQYVQFADDSAIDAASTTATAAIVSFRSQDATTWQMHAKAKLSAILCLLGEHENVIAHYTAANAHLREALDHFKAEYMHEQAFHAELMLANSLSASGTLSKDAATLEEAIQTYKGLLSKTQHGGPAGHDEHKISVGLGMTLAKLGQLVHSDKVLELAQSMLTTALEPVEDTDQPATERMLEANACAALARTIVQRADLADDEGAKAAAAPFFHRAITHLQAVGRLKEASQLDGEARAAGNSETTIKSRQREAVAFKPVDAPAVGAIAKPQRDLEPTPDDDHADGEQSRGYLAKLRAALKLPPARENQSDQPKAKLRFG